MAPVLLNVTQLRHVRYRISPPPKSFISFGLQSLEGCGLDPRLAVDDRE